MRSFAIAARGRVFGAAYWHTRSRDLTDVHDRIKARGAGPINSSRERPRRPPTMGYRRRRRMDRARAAPPAAPGSGKVVLGALAMVWSSFGPRPERPRGGRRRP